MRTLWWLYLRVIHSIRGLPWHMRKNPSIQHIHRGFHTVPSKTRFPHRHSDEYTRNSHFPN